MKKKSAVLLAVSAIAFLFHGCSFYRAPEKNLLGIGVDNHMVDGPGMERPWTDYALFADWIEIVHDSDDPPSKLTITEDTCTFYYDGKPEKASRYSLPEEAKTVLMPKGEIYLQLQDQACYEALIFHEELFEDGKRIPILSATAIELDGRGEIVLTEFALASDIDELPEDFYSSTYIDRNNREISPPMQR